VSMCLCALTDATWKPYRLRADFLAFSRRVFEIRLEGKVLFFH
jgi:hypothetical protein